jgi:hypothetical protein
MGHSTGVLGPWPLPDYRVGGTTYRQAVRVAVLFQLMHTITSLKFPSGQLSMTTRFTHKLTRPRLRREVPLALLTLDVRTLEPRLRFGTHATVDRSNRDLSESKGRARTTVVGL